MTKRENPVADQLGPMAAALAPIRQNLPGMAKEREILRVVATIPAHEDHDLLDAARDEVLRWARRRAAGELPKEAWEGQSFEALAAGRTTMAALVTAGDSVLWSLRGDDPDKAVPGRIWSTEVSLGRKSPADDIQLGVRLVVNSAEPELTIEPAVPGLVRQVVDRCGLRDGDVPMHSSANHAAKPEHVATLLEWLHSGTRRLPIIVATEDERADNSRNACFDVDDLAAKMCGLAHVVWVPADLTFGLSDALGKSLSVFHGGVRVYEPGLSLLDDPRDHRLILGQVVDRDPQSVASELRRVIARESLRRTRLGHDVLSFAAVRSAATRATKEARTSEGAGDSEKLSAALAQIEALTKQAEELQSQVDQAWQLSEDESSRAEASERQLHASWARIETLEDALSKSETALDAAPDPETWDEFGEWCDAAFSGKLALTPSARRGLRKALFQDVAIAAECIRWLAGDARKRFVEGGGALANIPVFDGITNAPCGGDEYVFDYQGRRLSANWHLKNGGNTRQPERCLRIYYTFDAQYRQIVVSDMPAHIRTAAS
ncbi:hypothetical protein ABDJ38_05395 [Aurantiacibacter sp. DGU5]|uniref:Uncharacterized protein n=2 Tax=Aurantiacibacter flavus TaxID=3145232 RepID=A0ABV0CVA1_9SPHN